MSSLIEKPLLKMLAWYSCSALPNTLARNYENVLNSFGQRGRYLISNVINACLKTTNIFFEKLYYNQTIAGSV